MRKSHQRSTKLEVAAVREVLKCLWEKAYLEGSVKMVYSPEQFKDARKRASILYHSLADHRAIIKKKKLENYDLFKIINACSLTKIGIYGVEIIKKEKSNTLRSEIIWDLKKQIPNLVKEKSIGEESIDEILTNIKNFN